MAAHHSYSRRTILGWLVARLGLRRAFAAPLTSPSLGTVEALASGFRKTTSYKQRYVVTATVNAVGLRIFTRKGVGAGYAAVELGQRDDVTCAVLQFAAGSWPDRAGSLNRFGVFREAVAQREQRITEHAFAGFLTSSKEESLGEARQALRRVEGGMPVTVAWGHTRNGRTSAQVAHTEVAPSATWTQSEAILEDLLRDQTADSSRNQAAAHVPGFLAVMRAAGLSRDTSFASPFLHNAKLYHLRIKWKTIGQELAGELRNERGEKTADFRAYYLPGDASGVPVRFDYNPRSYLKLTFEADPVGSCRIADLLAE